jgi:HAD superfamily hydrolase (TIGR01509 family)
LTIRRAVVFDLDGLMVDTEPLSRQAWAHLLERYGHALDDETYERMIGFRSDTSSRIVLEAFDLPLTASEIAQSKEAIFDKIRANGVPVMHGLNALQAELLRRDIPWAVATSSSGHHARIILEQLGLSSACQAIAAGDEVVEGKPAPDVYLLAARRLGYPPDECLALEDSLPGCQAAYAAGMTVVAVPKGQTKASQFRHAHHVFSSLQEVANNLEWLLPPDA